jgi:transcriptional regulator GlxA family with amidase domain
MDIGQGLARARSSLATRPAETAQRATRLINQASSAGEIPSMIEAHLLNIEALLHLNRLAEAQTALDRAFEVARSQSPSIPSARLHAMHARLLLQEGKTTLALAAVLRALALPEQAASERADLYMMLAYCHGRLHHIDAGLQVMREHVLPLSFASGNAAAVFSASARMTGLLHVYACAALGIPHPSLRRMKRPAKADPRTLIGEAETFIEILNANRPFASVGEQCYGYAMEGLIRSLGSGLDEGRRSFETGLRIAGSSFPRARMHLLFSYGAALRIAGCHDEAVSRFEDAGAIATATNDRRHQRLLRYELALCARSGGTGCADPTAEERDVVASREGSPWLPADGQGTVVPGSPRPYLPVSAPPTLTPESKGFGQPATLASAEDFINRNLQRRLPVVEIARACGVSVRKLQQLYQQYKGRHISDIVREKRMMLARRLLETDRLSVSDVADRLGYSCPANFSRDFKQHVGIAASEARWREATPTREQPEHLP